MVSKVVLISGPTGVGKTRVAQALCALINGEIISCDSVQIFQGLDIGSNKERLSSFTPSGEEIPMPQHLVDIVSWNQDFSAGDYYDACSICIQKIISSGKVPLIVGGTGFYMNWLLRGKAEPPEVPENVYFEVKRELSGKTWDESLSLLRAKDPEYALTLTENDFYRLERAIAVFKYTGKPNSSFCFPKRGDFKGYYIQFSFGFIILIDVRTDYDFRCFYLSKDRIIIARNIDERCEQMIHRGLISEVINLVKRGFHRDCTAGRAIGYSHTLAFLQECRKTVLESPQSECLVKLDCLFVDYLKNFQSASRNFSRKQDQWFHGDPQFNWLHDKFFNHNESSLVDFLVQNIQSNENEFNDSSTSRLRKEIDAKSRFLRFETGKAEKEMRTFSPLLKIYFSFESRKELIQKIYNEILDLVYIQNE